MKKTEKNKILPPEKISFFFKGDFFLNSIILYAIIRVNFSEVKNMAFAGMFIGTILLIIVVTVIIVAIAFGITAIILKIIGKAKDNKKLKVAGNVFLVLSIVNIAPIIIFAGYLTYKSMFAEVVLPDGKTKNVSISSANRIINLAQDGSDEAITEIEKLLDKNPNLVYFHDINRRSILDVGLKNGNAKLVRTAIEHGAVIDNPERYEHMAYDKTSMEEYLENMIWRDFTRDDIEIITLLFENGADTSYKLKIHYYSNAFGMAVWGILYNDGVVTNDELEFMQVIIDNGVTHDNELILMEDLSSNYHFSDEHCRNVRKDDNYYLLMEMIEGNR